jgi:ATP-binding cassette subfamily F protein 3
MRQELQQIDTRLGKLASERGKLEAQMATGTMAGADMAEAGRRLNHIAAEVAMLEERWLELQTEIETLGAQLG